MAGCWKLRLASQNCILRSCFHSYTHTPTPPPLPHPHTPSTPTPPQAADWSIDDSGFSLQVVLSRTFYSLNPVCRDRFGRQSVCELLRLRHSTRHITNPPTSSSLQHLGGSGGTCYRGNVFGIGRISGAVVSNWDPWVMTLPKRRKSVHPYNAKWHHIIIQITTCAIFMSWVC